MSFLQSAVLVVDVQRGLFDEAPRLHDADAVVHQINFLTARAREAGVPVAFIQHESAFLVAYSDDWKLEQGLFIAAHDAIVRKQTPDSFLNTKLNEWLTRNAVGRVVVCGYATEFCVDTTTRRAAALGYEVVLASDAHTTHDKDHASAADIRKHHNATLPNITSFGPKISAVESTAVTF